jgi:hypothetical protein
MKFASQTYAHLRQDLLLQHMMQLGRKDAFESPGFYIDIGPYHSKATSTTYHFYKLGWSGICIDPNPETEAAFKEERPRDTFVRCELSNGPGISSPCGAPVRSLDEVIANRPEQIDFISIDAEGLELQILSGFSFEKYRPLAVVFESKETLVKHGKSKIFQMMTANSYTLAAHTWNDAFYVRNVSCG